MSPQPPEMEQAMTLEQPRRSGPSEGAAHAKFRELLAMGDASVDEDEDGAVEFMQIDPADELPFTEDEVRALRGADVSPEPPPNTAPPSAPPARPVAPKLAVAQGVADRLGLSPQERDLSTIESMAALSRVAKGRPGMERLEAHLSYMPVEARERIWALINLEGWKPHDPEVQFACLWGHLAAMGYKIPDLIDSAADGLSDRLGAQLDRYGEVPENIQVALEEGRKSLIDAGATIEQLAETYAAAIRDGLRASTMEAAGIAANDVDAQRAKAMLDIQAASAKATELLGSLEKAAEDRLSLAPLKVASDISKMVKAEIKRREREDDRWKWLASALGGAVFGMVLMFTLLKA